MYNGLWAKKKVAKIIYVMSTQWGVAKKARPQGFRITMIAKIIIRNMTVMM